MNHQIPAWVQYITSFGPLVAAVTAMTGWFFVSRDNNFRENRKEIRSYSDSIILLIENLNELAIQYYTNDTSHEFAKLNEYRLTVGQNKLRSKIKILNEKYDLSKKKGFDLDLSIYFQKLTGGDFRVSSRQRKNLDDILLHEIFTESLQITEKIDSLFQSNFNKI